MKKFLFALMASGLLLLTASAPPPSGPQSRHGAPGTERKSTARRVAQTPSPAAWNTPVRTFNAASQQGFALKANTFRLPRKAQSTTTASGLNLPSFQGNVTYSDAWTPMTYPTLGVYSVPTAAGNGFEMLVDGPNGNRGGVVKDGIYFCHTYESFMGMFNYYDIFGYNLETGSKVFEFNGPNVGFMTQGLAVDPTDGTVYGLFYRENGEGMRLASIDYKTAENDVTITHIADIDGRWNALACTSNGQLYGIMVEQDATTNEVKSSSLCKIDKATAAIETVGTTGQLPFYFTGATIDTKTDRMFWTVAPANQTGYLCEVSLSTGVATIVYHFPDNEEVTALWVKAAEAEDGAPAAATDLTADFVQGSLSGTVSFASPTTTFDGQAAEGELNYTVTLNGAIAAQGTTSYGAKTTATVTAPSAAEYEIAVVTANAVGQSPAAKTTVFIGKGIPESPVPMLVYADGTMTLSWNQVSTSANGGYIDPMKVTYTISRLPEGIVVAENYAGTTFSEKYDAPAELTKVSYSVVARYDEFASEPAVSNSVVLGSLGLPYSQNFDSEEVLDVYTIIDGNNDGLFWGINSGAAYLRFNMSLQLDDWLITPPLDLKAGQCYRLSFDAYAQNAFGTERLEVKYGTGNTAADMTMAVMPPTDLTNVEPARYQFDLTPAADGRYFIGFHGISPADTYGLFVDNLDIAQGFATEGPAAVAALKAVPDPDGLAKIEISFTTPRRTYSGKTLDNITEVKILDGDKELTSFAAPAKGTRLTYTDTREGQGPRSYTVVCYNEAGRGVPATVNSYCGIDIPGMTDAVAFVETENEGEVTISWQPIAADHNGNAINPDKIRYNLYSVESGQLIPLAQDITATIYSTRAVDSGSQRFAQYAVTGVSDAGEGQPNGSDMRAVGTPYSAIDESFGEKQLGNYIWGMQRLAGQPNFGIYGPEEFGIDGIDLDGGFFVVQAGGNTAGDSGAMISGKVSMPAEGRPCISLYAYCNGSDDANELEIRVAEVNGDYKTLGAKAANSAGTDTGWHKLWWDMSDYAGKTVSLQIAGTIKVYSTLLIDRIHIGTLHDKDLAIVGFSSPDKITPGNSYTCSAAVLNDGIQPLGGMATVMVDESPKALSNLETGILEPGRLSILSLPMTLGPVEKQEVGLYVLLSADGDTNNSNDTSARNAARLRTSGLPGVTDLDFDKADAERQILKWTAPNLADIKPEAIDESFESGTSFAQEFEGWTFVDVDKKAVGGSYAFEIPGIVTGSSPASFVVFDTTDPVYNLAAHSGSKMLASFFVYEGGQTDDWAISPELSGNAQTISFYARSYMGFAPETIEVYYSTGSTDPADFVPANNAVVVPEAWTRYTVDLPAGARHFAVRSCATDGYFLFLDDFEFERAALDIELKILGYDVYAEMFKINDRLVTETQYDLTEWIDPSRHTGVTFRVITVYEQGVSCPSNAVGTVLGVNGIDSGNDISIEAGNNTIVVSGAEGLPVEVFAVDGRTIFTATGSARTTIAVPAGIYIVRAGAKTAKVILK